MGVLFFSWNQLRDAGIYYVGNYRYISAILVGKWYQVQLIFVLGSKPYFLAEKSLFCCICPRNQKISSDYCYQGKLTPEKLQPIKRLNNFATIFKLIFRIFTKFCTSSYFVTPLSLDVRSFRIFKEWLNPWLKCFNHFNDLDELCYQVFLHLKRLFKTCAYPPVSKELTTQYASNET